jgi:hypothetical protein
MPAAVDRPNHVLVRDEHVVEEDLVELRAAGRHPQRPDRDALGVHVDDHHRDAVVLGRVRVRAHSGEAVAGVLRAAGPDLLAVDQPARARLPVHSGRPRPDARRVGSGARLAEQLAPDHLLIQRGRNPAGDLLGRAVLDQGEDHPAGDPEGRALQPGGGEFLLDDQLLHGAGVPAPRLWPVRHQQPGLDQRLLPRVAAEVAQALHL